MMTYTDGRFYVTTSFPDQGDPVSDLVGARVCDEDSGVLAWTNQGSATWIAHALELARLVVETKQEGGDLLGAIDALGLALEPGEAATALLTPAEGAPPEEGDPCPRCGKPLQWDRDERILFCIDDYSHG